MNLKSGDSVLIEIPLHNHEYRYLRQVLTVDGVEFVVSPWFDMHKKGRWSGFPVAFIYSGGITSAMRREGGGVSDVTIFNVLQWHMENNTLEISGHAVDRFRERRFSIETCVFLPVTLIIILFEKGEFRFHQLVRGNNKDYVFVFVVGKGGYYYPHDKLPTLDTKTDLEMFTVRPITVYPATDEYFNSIKTLKPAGAEFIAWFSYVLGH
ncbi:hypothetical protein F4X86_03230 [Candidatus Saccharibacteria bacterium]|nr:hypothetical protein [Candidatus Saccharibacteria bacterium]